MASTASHCHPAFGIGHRGARQLTKENTLDSFRKCVELGINMIEFDINITSDNVLVIYHDPQMQDERPINKMTFLEFQQYDQDYPSLESMLTDPAIAQSDIQFYFDIKDTLVTAPLMAYLQLLSTKDPRMAPRCWVASFTPSDIAVALAMRGCCPLLSGMRIGGIFEDEEGRNLEGNPAVVYPALHYDFLSVKSCLVTKELVQDCHDHKLLVFSWTVNTDEECEKLREMEIDGYCSDSMDVLLKYQCSGLGAENQDENIQV